MARIAIDCDGVLANFVKEFSRLFNLRYAGRNITEAAWTSWGGGGQFTKTEEKEIWKIIRGTPMFWATLEAYRDCVSELARWLVSTKGHTVWVLTSRAELKGQLDAAWQTEQWLRQCQVIGADNYLGVITVPDSDDKVDICSRLDIRWIIDDKVETVESMDRFPYLHAALMNRQWNQQAQVKWRVKSMAEFLGRIK